MTQAKRLLIAASGTGGHVFPAIAVAEQLPTYQIEWLGVPDRLEKQLVPSQYPLHLVDVEGFQKRGLVMARVAYKLVKSIWQVRQLIQQGQFDGVFTTGGYIAAPAVMAARSLGLPVILHESNALPGKVTRLLSRWCDGVAIGFAAAAQYLPSAKQITCVGTPVREQFLQNPPPPLTDLDIPEGVPLLTIVGGSQGAVAVNKIIRDCAPAWLDVGIWIVHQTGANDPDANSFQHPHYFALPFYSNMAGLFQRSHLVISRSGSGTLTELAITHTPSILIPYPFAADDHQAFNAQVFAQAGAAKLFRQTELTAAQLKTEVLDLLTHSPSSETLQTMKNSAAGLAIPDSAAQLAVLIRQFLEKNSSV
jgi:UDP-N-acetylglucosamine--N-acetylmuramyl-(pentapeptide) pyrophosphoryl-undecaprenol N-acetylglucosamine transferase